MIKLTSTLLAAATLATCSLALANDQPTGAEPAPAKAEPARKDTRPVKGDLVSPDAANAVDQEELIKKLTGEDKGGAGPEKKFAEIIGRMGDSARRLKKEDPGPVTVEIQQRIVLDLDDLIEMAKKSQPQSNPQQKPQDGQAKQKSEGQKQGSQPGNGQGGSDAAQSSQMRDGSATAQPGQELREKGAEGWGNLPPRDRDLVTQSQREDMLPSYRQAIEKYYEELAKLNRAGQSGR